MTKLISIQERNQAKKKLKKLKKHPKDLLKLLQFGIDTSFHKLSSINAFVKEITVIS